jgi:hypothetical protein
MFVSMHNKNVATFFYSLAEVPHSFFVCLSVCLWFCVSQFFPKVSTRTVLGKTKMKKFIFIFTM